jgi:hypothetical protein
MQGSILFLYLLYGVVSLTAYLWNSWVTAYFWTVTIPFWLSFAIVPFLWNIIKAFEVRAWVKVHIWFSIFCLTYEI